MAYAKQTPKRKRRKAALPALGAAGVTLAMAGGATAATAPGTDVPSYGTAPHPAITLGEEEISDVSLATFYVFDRENAGTPEFDGDVKLAAGGCRGGGCGGCGGCRGGGGGCHAGGCGGARGGVGGCAGGCRVGGCRGCRGCGGCGGGWWGGGCGGWWWGGCSCCLSWGGCSVC